MNAQLFRANGETRDPDISFSHVGPGHERAYFSLIPIAGYAAVNRTHAHPYYAPPFNIYSMGGEDITVTNTIPSAKRAVRIWVKNWLKKAGESVVWRKESTGVHFTGRVSGIQVANYYFCPKAKGNWDAGFRVWFGGTYYLTEFVSPAQARDAVQATFARWRNHAKESLL
jgi:hypothetical protein